MLTTTAVLMTLLAGGEPDGVVATARAPVALDVTQAPVAPSLEGVTQEVTPHNLTTDQQIDRWIKDRRAETETLSGAIPWQDDRKPHGEFSVSVGTGGYRAYGGAVSLPIGESGRLEFSFSQLEGDDVLYPYGYHAEYDDLPYGFSRSPRLYGAPAYYDRLSRPEGFLKSRLIDQTDRTED